MDCDANALAAAWMAHMRRGASEAAHRISDLVLTTPAPDPTRTPRHRQRVWDGRDVTDRVVLVPCYHGLGDTIQCARFLPTLGRRARQVHLWAPAPLLPLLASVHMPRGRPLCLHALHNGSPPVAAEVAVEIMELLHLLRVDVCAPSPCGPYLQVDGPVTAPPADGCLHVGLVWSAGTWNPARSIPTEALQPLWRVEGVRWHSLQHAPPDVPLRAPVPWMPVHTHGRVCDTARTMLGLDLVISVDSMPAHLAGALGCRVWTLLPYEADWRWQTARDDTPWYPRMQLVRQSRPGDWDDVVARVVDTLLASRGRPHE